MARNRTEASRMIQGISFKRRANASLRYSEFPSAFPRFHAAHAPLSSPRSFCSILLETASAKLNFLLVAAPIILFGFVICHVHFLVLTYCVHRGVLFVCCVNRLNKKWKLHILFVPSFRRFGDAKCGGAKWTSRGDCRLLVAPSVPPMVGYCGSQSLSTFAGRSSENAVFCTYYSSGIYKKLTLFV